MRQHPAHGCSHWRHSRWNKRWADAGAAINEIDALGQIGHLGVTGFAEHFLVFGFTA